jgi:hypothetical protein
LIPDGDGNMHLIDLNRFEAEAEAFFNPEVDTAFLLFTRFNPTIPQRITWTSESIAASNFNAAHPTRLLIDYQRRFRRSKVPKLPRDSEPILHGLWSGHHGRRSRQSWSNGRLLLRNQRKHSLRPRLIAIKFNGQKFFKRLSAFLLQFQQLQQFR